MTAKKIKLRAKPRARKPKVVPVVVPFDPDVVEQMSTDGTPMKSVAILLGFEYDALSNQGKVVFKQACEKGLAQCISQTFAGLRLAAGCGDTKAIQMMFDYLGVRQAAADSDEGQRKPPRLLVEVTVADE